MKFLFKIHVLQNKINATTCVTIKCKIGKMFTLSQVEIAQISRFHYRMVLRQEQVQNLYISNIPIFLLWNILQAPCRFGLVSNHQNCRGTSRVFSTHDIFFGRNLIYKTSCYDNCGRTPPE